MFTAGPVSAQSTAEVYLGSASGRALNVQVLGQGITAGVSSAKATSQLTAVAEGAGVLSLANTTASVNLSGSGADSKGPTCAVGLPVANILDVGLACGFAEGSLAGGNPFAKSEGKVAGLTLDVQNILGLAGLNSTVTNLVNETVLETAKTTVAGLPLGLGATLTPVVETVQGTVADLLNTRTLEVTAGKSTSSVVTDGSKVTSSATASGAEIKILPLRLPGSVAGVTGDLGPLATITVGAASAKAVYDRSTGTSTPSFDPSLVTIKIGPTALLPAGTEVKVPVGASQTILAGTPLESDIIVAAGKTVTNPDGTVGAVADAVKLHLLKGVSNGILVELAHAEAGVGGTPAAAAPAAAPGAELPRTGGTPWIPLAGVSILGLAVLVRRVLVRAY
ncbi:MAG TPA: LPXTG cell wall anchor domain-containing protein [Acidimicrobiales bacterium]|nr:LPXTG cell wall anchor domain-containing protein [Acidimicrobiales bacterium]